MGFKLAPPAVPCDDLPETECNAPRSCDTTTEDMSDLESEVEYVET